MKKMVDPEEIARVTYEAYVQSMLIQGKKPRPYKQRKIYGGISFTMRFSDFRFGTMDRNRALCLSMSSYQGLVAVKLENNSSISRCTRES